MIMRSLVRMGARQERRWKWKWKRRPTRRSPTIAGSILMRSVIAWAIDH